MPVNPVSIENPYALPPLRGDVSLTDEERRRLGMRVDSPQAAPVDTREALRRALIEEAESIRSAHGVKPGAFTATRSSFSLADAVPMSEWKPTPQPLPMSRRDALRGVLESRERQLRTLEQFASDPRNPVSQDEVERIRGQIEAEASRALEAGTLPSPVAMYETLVEQDSPEVVQAKTKENLLTIPGFKQEWGAFVTFDENNQPVYPKWMEKPMEAAMAKAMGVAEEEAEDPAVAEAIKFQEAELKRAMPKPTQYENGAANPQYATDLKAWENKMRAFFVRTNPDAARLLPTFAEEQGFAAPGGAPTPAAAPAVGGAAPEPPVESSTGFFNPEEVDTLRVKLGVEGIHPSVMESPEHLRGEIAAGRVSPGDSVIISKPSGAVAYRLGRDGKLIPIARHSSKRI